MKIITKRALCARINRQHGPNLVKLKKTRSPSMELQLGEYYTVDLRSNCVLDTHIDLESYGRELGVQKSFEGLQAE